MDSVDRSAVTPSKSRLARALAKVFHIRKLKSHEKVKIDEGNDDVVKKSEEDGDEKIAVEAFVAKLFASISAVKAAYAELQYAQSPYDPEVIHAADQMVVSELKLLSELKQCYSKKQIDQSSPGNTLLLAEIKEQKCILKTYETMVKKLDSQLKLKGSEIMFLKEKLKEVNKENKLVEKRLNSSCEFPVPDKLGLSTLNHSHFIRFFRQTLNSIRSFVRKMSWEMESAGWDLDAAASSIQPDSAAFLKAKNRRCYAFESYVCREMFDGFNFPDFNISSESLQDPKKRQRLLFDRFMELKPVKPADYLAWKPKSTFARFCSKKYTSLVHPDMEESLFGNCEQRKMVKSGEYPETAFFSCFAEMAKRVWLLHCLAFSFHPEASIFQVSKGTRFSHVYMYNANDEPLLSCDTSPESQPRVAFTVVPGFRIGTTVIQCLVFLS